MNVSAMTSRSTNLLNPFGQKNGRMVTVDDVDRGDTGVTCYSCKDSLIPKKGNLVVHHFSHKGGGGRVGGGNGDCGESALHQYCKEFLFRKARIGKKIAMPKFRSSITKKYIDRLSLKISVSRTEYNFPEQRRRADVAMRGELVYMDVPTGIEISLAVEIAVTNSKDEAYTQDLAADDLAGIEITISNELVNERKGEKKWEQTINPILMSSIRQKRWLRMPDGLSEMVEPARLRWQAKHNSEMDRARHYWNR